MLQRTMKNMLIIDKELAEQKKNLKIYSRLFLKTAMPELKYTEQRMQERSLYLVISLCLSKKSMTIVSLSKSGQTLRALYYKSRMGAENDCKAGRFCSSTADE